MGEIRDNLQANIALYLKQKNISQKELSELLGVSKASVTHWIQGKNSPDIELIAKMCDIFNVKITDLMGYNNGQVNFNLTPHEKEVITSYRQQPELQYAVDKMLDVEHEYIEKEKHA